jgi:8-oxo-dGTP pyrophosphatase MutT (NUDIX family)
MIESKLKKRKQVAALPVTLDADGRLRVLLITSRETKRFIVPKGWPMKGKKDHRAAAIEAKEEAGVVGRVHRKAIGTYTYWKRRADRFEFCEVHVFALEVAHQLKEWREKGQRQGAWLLIDDAIELVDEPGLVTMFRCLPDLIFKGRKRGSKRKPASNLAEAVIG